MEKNYSRTDVLIVGAGPAGLACAMALKKLKPELDVCVIDKANGPGNHNLSGAVLEGASLHKLLDKCVPGWSEQPEAVDILGRKVEHDDLVFLTQADSYNISRCIEAAKALHLSFGNLSHKGDYLVSISKLSAWLVKLARALGVEVLFGFAAEDIKYDSLTGKTSAVKVMDQGLSREGRKQPNYLPGEWIEADYIVLAEGCDGYVTEKFVTEAGLKRVSPQLFSVGIKELIQVSEAQYASFGGNRAVHAVGYPLWIPVLGPGMFGGGFMYSFGNSQIAVGMIVGADWQYCDFNPQDALELFKMHPFVRPHIEGGTSVEAGAKMIPEGGLYALPRDMRTNAVGKGNTLLLGDGAGFVNMLKIKGLHNALESGLCAAEAIVNAPSGDRHASDIYTRLLDGSVMQEMEKAKNFRQTVARLGNLAGFPISVLGRALPRFDVEPDFKAMRARTFKFKPQTAYDKNAFTALANTGHREDQPVHCKLLDPGKCASCAETFKQACITFCPAGVYENIQGALKPANASNCLHCKTCQRKCPADNLRWTTPEGTGGPRYVNM